MRNDALEMDGRIDKQMIDFTNRLHDRDKKAEAARALIYSCDGKVRLHYNEPQKPNRIGTLKQFVYGLVLVAGTYVGAEGYFQACNLRQQNADLHQQQISAQKKLDGCETVVEERERQNIDVLKQLANYRELAESRVARSVLEDANSRIETVSQQAAQYKAIADSRVERVAFEMVGSRLAETSSRLEDALKQAEMYKSLAEGRVERSVYEEINARLGEVNTQLEETLKQAAEYKALADSRIDRALFEQASSNLTEVGSKLEEALKRAEQGEQRLRECEQQSWDYRRELRATDDFLGKLVAEKNIDDYIDKLIVQKLRQSSFSSPPPWESHVDKFCQHLFGRMPCPALREIVRKNMYKSIVCKPGKNADETIKEWEKDKTHIEYSLK
ncbi:Uncharacterised protein [uncultured archaeon]|nr:Uncharacterised protein [uncultured archaeon]